MAFRAMLPRSSRCVTLRPLEHRDATAYAAGAADPDVRRLAHLPEPEYTPGRVRELIDTTVEEGLSSGTLAVLALADAATDDFLDRKSTRLNSSHVKTSYAVFSLKRKRKYHTTPQETRVND